MRLIEGESCLLDQVKVAPMSGGSRRSLRSMKPENLLISLVITQPHLLTCARKWRQLTYAVTVDGIECAFSLIKLRTFATLEHGTRKASIGQLVWGFFDYWAHRHDYANSVISVRTGGMISKRAKDWTRRIGNDRHLICIEALNTEDRKPYKSPTRKFEI